MNTFAQSTPAELGQDPFTLSPELLQLFQGYEGEDSANSLFNGDDMRYNGLFTTTMQQLGGASPDLTAPVRDNEDDAQQGPTFLVIRSEYSPTGDLTKDSEISLTVTVQNIGENTAQDIRFLARLEDNNATLLADPAPLPQFDTGSQIEDKNIGLIWTKLPNGQTITLSPGQSTSFTWSFKPTKDDTVLRWRMIAEYGAGESVLRQWIPIKNPNPTGVLVPNPGPGGGIPISCSTQEGSAPAPFPGQKSGDQIVTDIASRWQLRLIDGNLSWSSDYFKPVLKIWWDTLSAVECTPFLNAVNQKNGGGLQIMATNCIGILWGWYGGPCFTGGLAINIANQLGAINGGIPEKVTQNVIHELGHAYNNDRGSNPEYWVEHNQIYNTAGPISAYGAQEITENIADVMGYYVARCSGESFQATGPNPFAIGHVEFYQWAKQYIFGGVEFGPTAPSTVSC